LRLGRQKHRQSSRCRAWSPSPRTRDGAPLAGATVSAVSINTTEQRIISATTAEDGNFTLKLLPGDYIIHAEKDGYQLGAYVQKTVDQGWQGPLNLTLSEQPLKLRGTVSHNEGPLAGVEVEVSTDSGQSWSATTSADGTYFISNIPAGYYTVTFSKNGYNTVERGVNLLPPEYAPLNTEMERMPLPISQGFIPGYDLAHSLMIVALGMAVGTSAIALLVRYHVRKNPKMVRGEEAEESSET